MQGKDKVVVNKNTDNKENNRPIYPPYFAKRKAKMNKELIKILEETATSEVVASDKYGEYRVGVFLHGCCVVTVCYEDGVWSCQIYSDNPITYHPTDPLQVLTRCTCDGTAVYLQGGK